jgi:hypothetical protein
MKTTKNEALLILAQRIMDQRIKPMIDKAISMDHDSKPIAYRPELDNNDYAEYIASKDKTLVHINKHTRKDDETCITTNTTIQRTR